MSSHRHQPKPLGNAARLSRSQALIDITRDYLRDTGCAAMAFSKLVSLIYLQIVPAHQRLIEIKPWRDLDEAVADRIIQAQYKRFQRYMEREVPIPADLEEAWVEALPDPYRERAVVQLCGRYGAATVELSHHVTCAGVGGFMGRGADFMATLAAVMGDGKIDANDAQYLPELRQACRRLISVATGLVVDIEAHLEVPPDESFLQSLARTPVSKAHH